MGEDRILRVYLEPPMLATAVAGTFNFLNVLKAAVMGAGWRIEWLETGQAARETAPQLPGYALFHAESPTHDRALTFRRACHYPFWNIEPVQQRWRFHTALAAYDPETVNPVEAANFLARLRARVLPGPDPVRGDYILVPLQGRIRRQRSFQTMRPVEMIATAAQTGRPTVVTLHPSETYDDKDRDALDRLVRQYPNLRMGRGTANLLRDCDFVVTQNSAVAFDGMILGKPAVLFGQSDFHHIALNVADLGPVDAMARAPGHRPDFARYVFWFLRVMAINATAPDAKQQILTAMWRGGWPIG